MINALPPRLKHLAFEKRVPLVAHLDLTFACNERCLHCFRVVEQRTELTTRELLNLLEDLRQLGCLSLVLSGGEPTLREDFWEILAVAREKRFNLRLKSNLIALEPDALERLHAFKIMVVDTSLYGATSETHDKITGIAGSWKKTTENIKRLSDLGTRVEANCSVMTLNLPEISQMQALTKALGASAFDLDPMIRPRSRDDAENTTYSLNFEDTINILSRRCPIGTELADHTKIIELQPDPDLASSSREEFCNAGYTLVYINPYGDVTPCVVFPMVCGNIRQTPFNAIWTSSEVLCHYRTCKKSDLTLCVNCAVKTHCNRCPGIAFSAQESYWALLPEKCDHVKVLAEMKGHS